MQSLFFKRCTWAMNVYSSSGNANSNHQQEHQHDAFKRQKANNDTNNMHRQHNASSGIGRTHKHKHAYAIVWSIANYICNRWMLLRFYIGACYTHKYITNMKRMRATHIDIHDVHIHANLNTTRVCVVLLLHIPYRLRKMRLQLPSTNNCLAVVLRNRAQVPCIATTPLEQLPILQKRCLHKTPASHPQNPFRAIAHPTKTLPAQAQALDNSHYKIATCRNNPAAHNASVALPSTSASATWPFFY